MLQGDNNAMRAPVTGPAIGAVPFLLAPLLSAGLPCAARAAPTFSHIIIVLQENRTPDNIFGSNPYFERGVDIATSGVNSRGETIKLTAAALNDCASSISAAPIVDDNGQIDPRAFAGQACNDLLNIFFFIQAWNNDQHLIGRLFVKEILHSRQVVARRLSCSPRDWSLG